MADKLTVVFDIECYRDYFLVMFRRVDTGDTRHFEMYDGHPLDVDGVRSALKHFRLVGFNSNNYDLPMLMYACAGASCAKLKDASDAIIVGGLRRWEFEDRYRVKIPSLVDSIDIIEVAPGQASLKLYGGRLHSQKLQDLPIEPSAAISPEDREDLRTYCGNDLQTTIDLLNKLAPQIKLREQMSKDYGIDLRSKSDAQIAEAVIRSRVSSLLGEKVTRPEVVPGRTFRYQPPAFLLFTSQTMLDTFEMVKRANFVVDANGKVEMPKELADAKIKLGNSVYRMGIGGLHSSEKSIAHFADEDTLLIDRDVASYYPAIVLNTGLYPKHMGQHFTSVYRDIVKKRLEAKRVGDKVTADSLKITINGSFGKFGSKWSSLYSPDLMIQVTITGQLSLLMLIDALEVQGIPVVSANTDGIVIKCPKGMSAVLDAIVKHWEKRTGFETEETRYAAVYSRDVNNYLALKEKGGVKTKGAYAPPGLQKNAANEVCIDAVVNHVEFGFDIEDTIVACDDVRKFLTIRTVKGGAVKGDDYLGRVVRWYYSTQADGAIHYKTNGNKVARTDGAMPLMQLPDSMPADLDRSWYVKESYDILKDIGVTA